MLENFKKTAVGKVVRRFYIALYREPKKKIINKLHKYLQLEKLPQTMDKLFLNAEPSFDATGSVDIIVPIYNGYDYLDKLFEDLKKTELETRIILVDDKSTDERVIALEDRYAAENSNVIILRQKENGGFVKSVNAGLAIAKNHVALVNTDTELPDKWLERLMAPIFTDPKVATSTPYTNSGTICSFPDFGVNNEIYEGLLVDKLDSFFIKIRPRYVSMPTGVGFCMGMSKRVIDEIGVLDAETYGRGFAEENDWCQRAIKAGYKNVHVENLFVYHKHGGTFLSEEKERLIKEHLESLKKRYPSYDAQVGKYCTKDPNADIRRLLRMYVGSHVKKSVLFFDHNIGGGATSYLNDRKRELILSGGCVSVIRYVVQRNVYTFTFEDEKGELCYEYDLPEQLLRIGDMIHFDEIYVNEMVFYPHIWDNQGYIVKLKERQESRLVMLFHDYYAVCPSVNLIKEDGSFCNLPDKAECDECFKCFEFKRHYAVSTRQQWNENWKKLFYKCDEIRCFSEDTRKRVIEVFGDDIPITLVPHKVEYAFPIEKHVKTTDTVNIGVLGAMAVHKGSEFLRGLVEAIEALGKNARVVLLGYLDGPKFKDYKALHITGRYGAGEIPKLIYENDIDVFLVPAVWPETFSYTTEEIIKMGMPVAAFNLGAPAERVSQYEKGYILKSNEPKKALDEILDFAQKMIEKNEVRTNYKKVIYVAEYISFSSRYRMEHLKEELLYQGVPGEVYEADKLDMQTDWSKVSAVLIYRCRYMGMLPQFIAEAKKHGVPVIYDIDDFIFDYDAIKELEFFHTEEYENFDEYTALIHRCMEESDRIVVSTEHMKKAVSDSFGDKPCFVSRNAASAEMLILSAKAKGMKNTTGKKTVLGYFSGSNTHSSDFELIKDVLYRIMTERKDVYLKIVGCLELSKEFDELSDRILREGFMDWRELPKAIASVDINLMPLEEGFFQCCKSENKWMEAGLVEVPTIASYNAELSLVTTDGEDILLCKNDKEWYDRLCMLLDDSQKRNSIGRKAFERCLREKTTLVKNEDRLKYIVGEDG